MKSSLYGAGAEYALHSLLILAGQTAPVSVRDLAVFQKIPERFLAKLFSRLRKSNLVKGTEGITGGFVLAIPAKRIRIIDVLEAVDPGRILFACAEIRRNCALYDGTPPEWAIRGMCRIHSFMSEAEHVLKLYLASKTLVDLVWEFGCKAPPEFLRNADVWFRESKQKRTRRADARPSAITKVIERSKS